MSTLWLPPEMAEPPRLPLIAPGPIEPRYALLINPFYPKDPHASFGKHVLTPSLALTSFAATTPDNWRVEYWDENLLIGNERLFCKPLSLQGKNWFSIAQTEVRIILALL